MRTQWTQASLTRKLPQSASTLGAGAKLKAVNGDRPSASATTQKAERPNQETGMELLQVTLGRSC